MGLQIAEYLGVRVGPGVPLPLVDSSTRPDVQCPFRAGTCSKTARGNVPVCSLRSSTSGQLWIVCEHRLCASRPTTGPLTAYQVAVLDMILAAVIPKPPPNSVPAFQREGRVRRHAGETLSNDSRADYKVVFLGPDLKPVAFAPLIMEMQGGGETSNTGVMTQLVRSWEALGDPDPAELVEGTLPGVGHIATNAWRRQQEQFLFKGRTALLSGGRLVLVLGSILYDFLMNNLTTKAANLTASGTWNLAVLGIAEHAEGVGTDHSVKLGVYSARQLFTTFEGFVASLSNQSQGDPTLFAGSFVLSDGTALEIPESSA